ncbi:MAG: FAD-binding protein, partial [Chloroflexi bacterium]
MKNTVVIVGAGLTGLIAAQKLAKLGIRTIVLEQDSDVGGRMATCRIGGGLADYGCQFFTARSPEFIALVEKWRNAGMVFVWSHGWSDGSLKRTLPDGYPRYAVRGGMQALVQYLARDVDDIRTGFKIRRISLRGDHWLLEPQEGEPVVAYHLLLTPPSPVALQLLDAGGVTLRDEDRAILERIQYIP